MKKMRLVLFVKIVLLATFFISCNKDKAGKTAKFLSIKDGSSLAIKSNNSTSNMPFDLNQNINEGGELCQIVGYSNDLSVESVHFLDENKELLEGDANKIYVRDLWKINENLIVLEGEFNIENQDGNIDRYSALMVDLDSKEFFDFGSYFPDNIYSVQPGGNGNYFFLSSGKGYELTFKDSTPSVKAYTPEGKWVSDFAVDKNGNAFYIYDSEEHLRVNKANGGIFMSSYFGANLWADAMGNIYSFIPESNNTCSLKHLTFEDSVSSKNVAELSIAFPHPSEVLHFYKQGFTLIGMKYLMNHNTGSINEFTLNGLESEYSFYKRKGNYIYYKKYSIESGLSLKIVDLDEITSESNSYTISKDIYIPPTYELYSFSVVSEDEAVFYALRHSDGKMVNCQVKGDEIVTINESSQDSYIALTKVE